MGDGGALPSSAPCASIVIPAHNEAAVIGRMLRSVARHDRAGDIEVVVVANGCSDRTAEEARSMEDRLPHLKVIELAEPGKINALQIGDDRSTAFPRIYADADIEFEQGSLGGLIAVLSTPEPRVAAPRIRFDRSGASALVRAFYRVYGDLPYVTSGLVGLGVYGVSGSGRERFGRFPQITSDDMFVQRLFGLSERIQSPGTFVVHTPLTIGALVKVRTRATAGYRQLNQYTASSDLTMHVDRTTDGTMRALIRLIRDRPYRLPEAVVYAVVMVISRLRARSFDPGVWHRDDTSRR